MGCGGRSHKIIEVHTKGRTVVDIVTAIAMIAGLGLLLAGAEALVKGASRLAVAAGISPLVIGLTVVAFGTSSPELVVSVQASLGGLGDLAVGNVVGSNIFNVLIILGLAALVTPLVVAQQIVRVEVPLMIGVSGLLWMLALDGTLGRWEAALLVSALIAYTVVAIRISRKETKEITKEYGDHMARGGDTGRPSLPRNIALVIVGLAMLAVGSTWLVDGAAALARYVGLSELIIGLTIVAAGTSLPEVATSVLAAIRGERDIAVGNVVGSNIFNILGVAGIAGIVSPAGLEVSHPALSFDIPVMTAVAVACLPIFFTGHTISRWEGAVFLAYYVAYTLFLVLDASDHDALPDFSWVMSAFILPLTAVTLTVVSLRAWRKNRKT
jgi:cation:H+ antiporter